ncbi:MAG: VPDSG-CTERM sorting domain-containing protein [Akkermansiaceae bacterium]|nr:VPDSG-CTERM sorting domain-containing protein [Akkermansiaceae bacterium]
MLSIAAMVLASPGLMADQIKTVGNNTNPGGYNGYGPYQTGVGGEFTLLTYSGVPRDNLSFYIDDAKNKSQDYTFQTFCVESKEFIYNNTTSYVTISDTTIYSDVTLKAGAAWLYWQFAAVGGLTDYEYDDAAGRHTSAGLLQNAIWAFMGQDSQTISGNSTNPFMIAALAALGGEANAMKKNEDYPVAVLHLWGNSNTTGSPQQDQLILTGATARNPTPDGGFTVALLGISLTGLAALRRRFQPAR